ncbi:tyrosine-type recombinase/integrase [Arthrobacter rhombi]|uniref:tyrosine-type recombinase/integrase n=1 Tax=Arthrobacter rhombi TaxID=71253 RepID=UPI003FCF5680
MPTPPTSQRLTQDRARDLYTAAVRDGPRSRALAVLLLTTGLRIGEDLAAKTADYGDDSGYRVLTITRKGGHRAKVVLSGVAVQTVDAYLGATGDELVQCSAKASPLFTTSTGRTWAASEAFRTVRRLSQAAGIEGRIGSHTASGTPSPPSTSTPAGHCTTSTTAGATPTLGRPDATTGYKTTSPKAPHTPLRQC